MSLTAVMGHASFSERRRELLPSILASWDGGISQVVEDDRRRGAWYTIRACWHEALRLSGGEGHLIAAQDDYMLAKGGYSFMREVCEANPDQVLCFRWAASNEQWLHAWAENVDAFWARSSYMWTGGATCVPAPLVKEFLDWASDFDSLLTRSYKHHDDTRAELFFMARNIDVLRCRWSLFRHLGKWSECRRAEREDDDEELSLVASTSKLPGLADSRWVVTEDVPSAVYVPQEFQRTVEVFLGDRAEQVGLKHVRETGLSTTR